jgi:integrase
MPKAKREPVVLTDAKVRSLRPDSAGEYVQGDMALPGFGVRVRPTGAPTYVLMKRLPGETKPTRVTIGRTDVLTLARARQLAREAVAAVKQGVNVNAEKRREQLVRKIERERARRVEEDTGFQPGTFGETAVHYIRQECAALRRGVEVEAVIRRHLLPLWGERPLDELRRRDLTAALDPIVADGKLQAAHKLREVGLRVINWAVDRGDIEVNYLATASRGRKRAGILRRSQRERVLSLDEIRSIWLASADAGQPFGTIIRLLLLLGQRKSEIAGMEWTELDLDDAGTWTIPTTRFKTGIAHIVPLPRLAIDLIRSVPRVCEQFVFSTKAGSRFVGFSVAKTRLDGLSGVTGWRIHDLRRTVRTGLAGLKVDPDVAERVIGHVVGGVRGIYDRHLYLDEKREALERWAVHLAGIIDPQPDRVVRMARR